VAIGSYLNDASLKKTLFTATQARYIQLQVLSEAQSASNAWTSAAEINILGGPDPVLPRDSWTISADSENTAIGNVASQAIDGDINTIWHTQYSGSVVAFPHSFTIDHGSSVAVSGLSYPPRPHSTGSNGRIGKYSI
jgi:galactose oxidase